MAEDVSMQRLTDALAAVGAMSPTTQVRQYNRASGAVRAECAALAATSQGRALLGRAAASAVDPHLRLQAAITMQAWDRDGAAAVLEHLIRLSGGRVVRPMTMTDALAVEQASGVTAALCLMNLDNEPAVDVAPALGESMTARASAKVPSAALDAAETVYSLAMNGGLDHAYELAGREFAPAAGAFDAVGASGAAGVLVEALAVLCPDQAVPAAREERARAVVELSAGQAHALEQLNGRLGEQRDVMERLERATEP